MIKAAMGVIRKISPRLAAALGDGLTKQIEAGYRSEDLALTSKGVDALLLKLADQPEFDSHLTDLAQKDIEEAEKEAAK